MALSVIYMVKNILQGYFNQNSRIPYEIGGDAREYDGFGIRFMLLSPSANRDKSWGM